MISHLSNTQKGILLALAGYSGFAFADTIAKFLTQHYSIFQIIAIEMSFASLVFLAFSPLLVKDRKGMFKVKKPWLHALRAVMNFLVSVFIVLAFVHLPLAAAYTIVFAKPFLAALLAIPIYKEVVTRERWLAIGLGFIGIVVAMRPGSEAMDPALFYPLLAALAAAVMWIVSRSMQEENSFTLGFYPAIGTALLCWPFAIAYFEPMPLIHAPLFMMGGTFVAIGLLGLSLAFRMAPSAAVSPFHYSQLVWGLLLGYLVFGDVPGLWMMLGAAIIIASGLYLVLTERRRNRKAKNV